MLPVTQPANRHNVVKWAPSLSLIGLLLLLFVSRLPGLQALPLHNGEGLHLTRALHVWRDHPFWDISDCKIINQWLIALFYLQNAPIFVGRIATVFFALPGLTAGFSIVQRWFGTAAGVIAAVLWLPLHICSFTSGWHSVMLKPVRLLSSRFGPPCD